MRSARRSGGPGRGWTSSSRGGVAPPLVRTQGRPASPSPTFFAPVAALVCLGMSYGQRLRRTVEIVVGVAVGVAVADLVVRVVGVGTWQIVLTVAVASPSRRSCPVARSSSPRPASRRSSSPP